MKTIDVGDKFSPSLTNRDHQQRDGAFTGVEFREEFLSELNSTSLWEDDDAFITLDFTNVRRLGPSWANEVFAYFTRFGQPDSILKKVNVTGISRVKLAIIKQEIETGYSKK
jgi:hypothetical protein